MPQDTSGRRASETLDKPERPDYCASIDALEDKAKATYQDIARRVGGISRQRVQQIMKQQGHARRVHTAPGTGPRLQKWVEEQKAAGLTRGEIEGGCGLSSATIMRIIAMDVVFTDQRVVDKLKKLMDRLDREAAEPPRTRAKTRLR